MSTTPKTDSQLGFAYTIKGMNETTNLVAHENGPFVLAGFARDLERDLYATQEAYVSAHSDRNKYRDAMLDLASGLRMIGAELHPDIAELVDSALRIYGMPENLSKQAIAAFNYVAKEDCSETV